MDKKSTISASDASNANVDLVDTNIKDATIKEELAKDNVVKDITKAMNDSIKKTDNEEAEDILKIMENHNE
jgi:regulator of protease activity HflC (stomatin/prohibitin superfamily)